MKGKTLLSLAIVASMLLSVLPLTMVKASPDIVMEIKFENGLNEITKAPCNVFTVTLAISGVPAPGIGMWVAELSWDPTLLELETGNGDLDLVEGPFMKSGPTPPTPATTGMLYQNISQVSGYIGEMSVALMSGNAPTGAGDLAYIHFHAIGVGDAVIHLVPAFWTGEPPEYKLQTYLLDPTLSNIVPIDTLVDGTVHIPPPPATPPNAEFTPANGAFFWVGDTINLDGSASTDGIDSIPPAELCPITTWQWDIDFGNDGSIDLTLFGETGQSFLCPGPGPVGITLTVIAPDPTVEPPPGHYIDTNSEKHVIQQFVKPLGPSIDVFTVINCSRTDIILGGIGPVGDYPVGWSDAYGPQQQVCVAAKVTYNDEPVEYKPVAFEVIDSFGNSIDFRMDFTDENGIACVCFRIPWEGSGAEGWFGNYSIAASVSISEVTVTDMVKFRYGYILSIRGITVTGSPLHKGETMTVDVDIASISMISHDTLVTVVACDECGVPIDMDSATITVDPEDGWSLGYSITIPSWAFVGNGIIYVNLFTKAPSLGGVPYCPEDTATFVILATV